MSACIFGDGFPATGRGEYADRCWGHQPEEQDSYPVLVTYTHEHVLWVPADSQEAAVEHMRDAPYEYTDDQKTLAGAWWAVAAPDRWDWDTVYRDGEIYGGLRCDAHVEAYRAHQRELVRAAEVMLTS